MRRRWKLMDSISATRTMLHDDEMCLGASVGDVGLSARVFTLCGGECAAVWFNGIVQPGMSTNICLLLNEFHYFQYCLVHYCLLVNVYCPMFLCFCL